MINILEHVKNVFEKIKGKFIYSPSKALMGDVTKAEMQMAFSEGERKMNEQMRGIKND